MRKEYNFSKGRKNKYAFRICPCTTYAAYGVACWDADSICKCAAKALQYKNILLFSTCTWPGHTPRKRSTDRLGATAPKNPQKKLRKGR